MGALTGYLAALASAAAMAFYTVTVRHTQDSMLDLLLAGTAIGALASLPIALGQSQAWGPGCALALSAAIGIAMLGAGYACWTLAMASPAGHAAREVGITKTNPSGSSCNSPSKPRCAPT
jgi:drug/metabolite transporter (DMT)-like permease